jgi:ubiquinone/menaquinone biosynthesis C-methylase UbiE
VVRRPRSRRVGRRRFPKHVRRARASREKTGLDNIELHKGLIESLPLDDASVDVVAFHGVIDLLPDKDAVFDEIDRLLPPGGRLSRRRR